MSHADFQVGVLEGDDIQYIIMVNTPLEQAVEGMIYFVKMLN